MYNGWRIEANLITFKGKSVHAKCCFLSTVLIFETMYLKYMYIIYIFKMYFTFTLHKVYICKYVISGTQMAL